RVGQALQNVGVLGEDAAVIQQNGVDAGKLLIVDPLVFIKAPLGFGTQTFAFDHLGLEGGLRLSKRGEALNMSLMASSNRPFLGSRARATWRILGRVSSSYRRQPHRSSREMTRRVAVHSGSSGREVQLRSH